MPIPFLPNFLYSWTEYELRLQRIHENFNSVLDDLFKFHYYFLSSVPTKKGLGNLFLPQIYLKLYCESIK